MTHFWREIIRCPNPCCQKLLTATVYADQEEDDRYHECEHCERTITAKDWDRRKDLEDNFKRVENE